MKLDTDLVRRLGSSRFNYWFGYAANGFWVLWLLARGMGSGPWALSLPSLLAYAAVGVVVWTLAEYLLHRFVYHVIPSFLSQGHLLHHQAPRELIGVPWYLTSVLLWGIFELLALGLHPGKTGAVMAGTWLGYIGYCLLHHGSHHWPMRSRYLRRVKQLHQLHHVYPDTNWGFTTHLWDVAFSTYLAPSAAKERSRARVRTQSVRTPQAQAAPAGRAGADLSLPSA